MDYQNSYGAVCNRCAKVLVDETFYPRTESVEDEKEIKILGEKGAKQQSIMEANPRLTKTISLSAHTKYTALVMAVLAVRWMIG